MQLPNATVPEIKRVNLTSTALELKSLEINDVLGFDFLDKPDADAMKAALKTLFLLEAIDKDGKLRALGRVLARFPIEPTYAKSLLAAWNTSEPTARDCCKMFALLSTESVWMGVSRADTKRLERQKAARELFSECRSDHFGVVSIFEAWKSKFQKGERAAADWAFQNCLQHRAF